MRAQCPEGKDTEGYCLHITPGSLEKKLSLAQESENLLLLCDPWLS